MDEDPFDLDRVESFGGRALYYDRDGNPISLRRFSELLQKHEMYRRVALTNIGDDIAISTVWLGIDHNFIHDGPPLIFETMVFGPVLDEEQWRYSTLAAAQRGHREAVALVRAELDLLED
jgi:hypothetical protein